MKHSLPYKIVRGNGLKMPEKKKDDDCCVMWGGERKGDDIVIVIGCEGDGVALECRVKGKRKWSKGWKVRFPLKRKMKGIFPAGTFGSGKK